MKIAFVSNRKRPWRVDFRSVGGGQRFFATEKEAKTAAKAAEKDRSEVGREWADLPAKARAGTLAILREMEAAGVSLADLWESYRRRQVVLALPGPKLEEAIRLLIVSKRGSNFRAKYVDGLENYLQAFAKGREREPVAAITGEHVLRWFSDRGEKHATKASNIGRLSSLFSFAIRSGWRTDNPVDRVERPRLEEKPPQILTVDQASELMDYVQLDHPCALAWFSLALMAGIRPEECDRLGWAAVNLQDGIVTIDAAASKVRRRRIVHLQPAAVDWLRLAKSLGAELPLAHVTRRRHLRAVREKLGFEAWPQDILRHSCASYLMALWQDAGRVAAELGNSAGILLRHYRELVRREDAERFWGIRPKSVASQPQPKET